MTSKYKPQVIIITLCVCLLFFKVSGQVTNTTKPNWLLEQNYNIEANFNEEEINQGTFILLHDEQIHVPKQEHYSRYAIKIVDKIGIQDASKISVNYDPTYQSISFHSINIIRNGKVINKLNLDDFQLIRQESNAENYIYDGSISAILNLSDVRTGDVIDYSYTVTGFNPIHNGHFSEIFILNDIENINKINVNIISKNKLNYKLFLSDLEPIITSLNGYINYQWQVENTETFVYEENTPNWEIVYHTLFISDYNSWEEVIEWALKLYQIDKPLSRELNTKIENIKSLYHNDGDKIKAVLDVVQNDVRYLGLESGIGSYKPFAPSKVYKQRFGDCKDKSLLMCTMLNKMNIKAYPMIVSTTFGKTIPEFLPTPKVFDHVVVKVIDNGKNETYYDPTISNQKGLYGAIYFPNYENGLVIKKGNTGLEELQNLSSNMIEVFDVYELGDVNKGATLKVKTVYSEREADNMRAYFENNSFSSLKRELKNYYSYYYDNIEIFKDPIFEDDSLRNIITLHETYKLNNIWSPMLTDKNKIGIAFTPHSIYNNIAIPTEKQRKNHFALSYPVTIQHNITVKLSNKWNITPIENTINSKGFYYEFEAKSNRNKDILFIKHYYKSQNSFVAPNDFKEYYESIKELENNISYYIFIPKNSALNTSYQSESAKVFLSKFFKAIIPFLIIVGVVIFGLIFYVIKSNRSNNNIQ